MGRHISAVAVTLIVVWGAGGASALARDGSTVPPPTVEVAPDGIIQELKLEDGSRLLGRVEEIEGDRVVFRTVSDLELVLTRDQIQEVRRVRGRASQGEFQPEDPNRTRLFFGPTARSLPRGRGYVGVYELVMPFVQMGVTDRFTVGGGTPLIYTGDDSSHPFWFTPKFQLLRGERTQVAAGVMHFVFTGDEEPVGIAYGVATHGTADASVTGGVGYGYQESDRGTWIGMLGGDVRVGRSLKLVAEGYVWQEGDGFLMGGVRLFGPRLSADLGVITTMDGDDTFVFPVVNVVWTF